MTFLSTTFACFFVLVFLVHWGLQKRGTKAQNGFLLLTSYFFYGTWDWKFLLLFVALSLVNFLAGLGMDRYTIPSRRKMVLVSALILNIGNLFLFKYFNFFVDDFIALFSLAGIHLTKITLTLIIPVGISFYTFLSISYLVDVYRKTIPAGKNPVDVLLSLSFFPIILAGPIQRPALLLPQIAGERKFDYPDMVLGLRQILWGLFTKVVIADNLAFLVDEVFNNPVKTDGANALLALLFFTIQIYADFSGYSDMAIGFGRLLGFQLIRNFNHPYFAGNIREFWQRWHISLTTWFRDYLFLPIAYFVSGKIKKEKLLYIPADVLIYSSGIAVTWSITGLWHGANGTYLVWGLIHGAFLILYQIQKKPRKKILKSLELPFVEKALTVFDYVIMMGVVMVAWVYFRSPSIESAHLFIGKIFSASVVNFPDLIFGDFFRFILLLFFFTTEWLGRKDNFTLERLGAAWPKIVRWPFYAGLICLVVLLVRAQFSDFLYFQF